MRRSTQRRGRQFPPQVSKEELLERTRETLSEKGVDYLSQAKYVVQIASEVVGFNEPIFSSLQPEIKFRNTPGWQYAYTLLLNYLHENGMEQTLDVIDIELQGQNLPQTDIGESTDTYMANLLKISKQLKRKSFASRVAEFTGKYKTRKTINQAKRTSPQRNPPSSTMPASTATTKRTSLTQQAQNTNPSPQTTKTFTRPAARPAREEPPKPAPAPEPKPRTSLLSSQTKPQQTNTRPVNRTTVQQEAPAPVQKPVQQQTAQPPKKSLWDPVPMAEPSKPAQNSFESVDFDIEEEEEEEQAQPPMKRPPPQQFKLPQAMPKPQMQMSDEEYSGDYSDDIPTVAQTAAASKPPPVTRTVPQQQPQQKAPATNGWDATPMDDGSFDDVEEYTSDHGNKTGGDVIEESETFDDLDLDIGDN